jgi:hypothetical protein
MIDQTRWRRHLAQAPDPAAFFNSVRVLCAHRTGAAWVKPSVADIARANANIDAWQTYLPKDCVDAMINDGWHWTT